MQDYTLAPGTHATADDGRCAMEWVSHLAGEPHSDQPSCVSPVLRALCIALNDGLEDDRRQRLRPYLARTIGTADDGLDAGRSWLALDWLARTWTPAWLSLAGLDGPAQTLRERDKLTGRRALSAIVPVLTTARRAARTERGRGYGTSWWAAVCDGRAARATCWAGAGSAAWSAARLAIAYPEAERACALLRAAAGDAAALAVHRVPVDEICGTPAPLDAARTALAATLESLEDEALRLLEAMLPTEIAVTCPEGAISSWVGLERPAGAAQGVSPRVAAVPVA